MFTYKHISTYLQTFIHKYMNIYICTRLHSLIQSSQYPIVQISLSSATDPDVLKNSNGNEIRPHR
jgi:hypothetical protein